MIGKGQGAGGAECGGWREAWGDGALLGSRIYCLTDIDPDHRKLSQLEAVVRFLKGQDPALECEFPSGSQSSGLCRDGGLESRAPCVWSSLMS